MIRECVVMKNRPCAEEKLLCMRSVLFIRKDLAELTYKSDKNLLLFTPFQ